MDSASPSIVVQYDHARIELAYPPRGDMRPELEAILQGREYPFPKPQGYEPSVIMDIGANVGAYAAMARLAYPHARLLCYEPSVSTFEYLRHNLRSYEKCDLINAGLSDRAATLPLYQGKVHAMQASIYVAKETIAGESETVDILDAAAEWDARGLGDVSLLKIDTEGSEFPILSRLGRERLSRVDWLLLEYHSDRDRRRIDELLDDFVLGFSAAKAAHRGKCMYISRRIRERYPLIDSVRIESGG